MGHELPRSFAQARQKYPQEETRGAAKPGVAEGPPKPAAPTINRRGRDGPIRCHWL